MPLPVLVENRPSAHEAAGETSPNHSVLRRSCVCTVLVGRVPAPMSGHWSIRGVPADSYLYAISNARIPSRTNTWW